MSIQSILFRIGAKKGDQKRDSQIPFPSGIQEWTNLSYGPHGSANLLDVYRPAGQDGCPIIVNIHGGGYVYGDKELYKRYSMDLARRGFAVVNINYRLAPRWKFPAPLEDITEIGAIYNGVVTRLMSFGAFVEIAPGKEGLVHISRLDVKRTEKVEDVVNVGDTVLVKVLEIDDQGRLNLSRRDALIEVKGLTPENDVEEAPRRDNKKRFGGRRNRD